MSAKNEKYSSRSAKMLHEKTEGKKERMMEYGNKPKPKPNPAGKKNMPSTSKTKYKKPSNMPLIKPKNKPSAGGKALPLIARRRKG